MAKHKKGDKKIKFCCARGTPCKCLTPNNYRTNCKPGWDPYAAHHILCVASVKGELAKKKGIRPAIMQTQWCVNKPSNMIALPLWGHTVKWYCRPANRVLLQPPAPPFANLPQHDWDHNGGQSYREEVERELRKIAADIAEEPHDANGSDIAGALDGAASSFRGKLRGRGTRQGGTDAGWRAGRDGSTVWYRPFSMSAFASSKGYPRQDWASSVLEKVSKKVMQLIAS